MEHPIEDSRAARLVQLIRTAFRLPSGAEIPAKLGLSPEAWGTLLAALEGNERTGCDPAPTLSRVHGALSSIGLAEAYMRVMAGMRFSPRAAGIDWARGLGPTSADREAFHRALGKLRLEQAGLRLERRVTVGGEAVDWAIAGLMPNGETLRLAVQVRPAPSHLEALSEDLVDDAVAAAGFEILAFREWQLRYAGACALHVAEAVARRAPHLPVSAKLLDPDDDHPIHRIQASPTALTPRAARPNWALRESLRAAHPDHGPDGLLALYRTAVVERSTATDEAEEWTLWG